MKKNFELTVSIGDASKALTALRTYGLPSTLAEEIIAKESHIAIYDHSIIPKKSIAPALIEMFGEQHIQDAITYAYLFMEEYGVSFEEYSLVIESLLSVFRPEELIISPSKIRFYIQNVMMLAHCNINENFYSAMVAVIEEIEYKNQVSEMSEAIYVIDSSDDDFDDEQEE